MNSLLKMQIKIKSQCIHTNTQVWMHANLIHVVYQFGPEYTLRIQNSKVQAQSTCWGLFCNVKFSCRIRILAFSVFVCTCNVFFFICEQYTHIFQLLIESNSELVDQANISILTSIYISRFIFQQRWIH